MQDIHHNPLKVGDSIRTSGHGVVEILSLIATDVVRVKVRNGSKVDLHLRFSQAEFVSPETYNSSRREPGVKRAR